MSRLFNGWQVVSENGEYYPSQIRHLLDGKLLRTENLSNISFASQVNDTQFDLGTDSIIAEFEPQRETVGLQSSQFFMRMFGTIGSFGNINSRAITVVPIE